MTESALSLASFGTAMLNHLWQSTVFAAAVWLVTLLLRRNPASIRSSLWLVASVKFLIPFSLLIGFGSLFPRPSPVAAHTPQVVYSTADAIGQPFSDLSALSLTTTHAATSTEELIKALPATLTALWLCGTAIVLLVWAVRWRQVTATLRRAVPMEDGREVEILRRLNKHARIPARASQEMMEPGIFGILRPVLVWPRLLTERLEDEHIEAILTHELTHVRRRDNLIAMLHMAVEAVFWFHPLVWWMERRMVEERERACDEAVVQRGGQPEIYAESLLKACRFCLESPLTCIAGITGADLKMRVRSIMTLRLEKLSLSRKVLLVSLGLAVVGGPVAFGVMRLTPLNAIEAGASSSAQRKTTAAGAQDSMPRLMGADGKPLEFEVVSVRPNRSGDETMNIVSPPMGDGITITNMPLENIIGWAYGITIRNQVSGMPDWAKKERFDIKAKVADGDLAAFRKVVDPIVRVSMLQKILVDRFKMTAHYETRMLAGYVLVVGKNGSKLTEVEPPIGPDGMKDGGHRRVGRGEYESFGMWMLPLVRQLMQELGCVVVDKTDLHGYYNYTLKWTPDDGQSAGDTAGSTSGPSIFTAVREQLGLKLEPTKVPTQVLVIDAIEHPSDN